MEVYLLRALAIVVLGLAIIATPVNLLFLGWAMKTMFLTAPVWVSVIVWACFIISALGIGLLIDKRQGLGPL
jgi:hypothetical protein